LPGSATPAERDPYVPPAGASAARAQLQVQVSPASTQQVGVGDFVGFEVFITNTGDATARGAVVESRFDAGLKHLKDTLNRQAVSYDPFDLAPGKTKTVPLSFQVVEKGTHCQTVTVTAGDVTSAPQRACVTVVEADLRMTVNGPRSRVAGDLAPFDVTIKNGATPVRNVEVVVRFATELQPEQVSDPSHESLADGSIALHVGDIGANEQRPFTIQVRCKAKSENACVRADLTADGAAPLAAEDCVEILPPAEGSDIFGT
jgi:uncharacterized repeat protein (TIGR01451 family)